jgi:capsular exopolysaccharide synthesis family protein
MSYIFDALQRSQAERTERDKTGSIATIELLERTERETTAQWKSEQLAELPTSAGVEHSGVLFDGEGFGPGAAEADPMVIAKALHDEERRETFSQFQTIEDFEAKNSSLVCLTDPNSLATEAFHLLGIRLRNLQRERRLKILLVTSTVPAEGKSTVAANLVCTLGSGGRQKVLLLGGDVRRPSLSQLFGFTTVPGLCDYLQGKRSLTACLYRLSNAGVWILPSGDNAGGSLELIQSPQLPKLMTTLGSWFDWIVIDSPPVLPIVDTSVWARVADGILLVARQGTTRKRELQKGLEALDHEKLIGALLNASTSVTNHDNYYYLRESETTSRSDAGRA